MLRFTLYILLFSFQLHGQFSVTLKYKMSKCGGKKNTDTTQYFLLANKKWILVHPSGKIDTIFTSVNGKINIPNKKGEYKLIQPWKYYHLTPYDFPAVLYDKQCITKEWETPDFTINVYSKKRYKLSPPYLILHCPDNHPCLRTDTVIPRIPKH